MSFWDGLFSGATLVFRECKCFIAGAFGKISRFWGIRNLFIALEFFGSTRMS